MIEVIYGSTAEENARELEQAFRLRHRVFVEELGWEALRRPDGLEIDQFDGDHAVHMLAWDGRRLVGYQRLLPTTRAYLLSEIYPHLCDGDLPRADSVYEWTRIAVDPSYRGACGSLGYVGASLVLTMVEWCLERDVTSVIVETQPVQLLKFVECCFIPHPLGVVHKIDGQSTIAIRAELDERTRDRLRDMVLVLEPEHEEA